MKKGSISLSINAIVVVVLAFVMLGLGLTLTRSLFTDIGSTVGGINEQIKQQVLDDLRSGNKPLSFPQSRVNVGFKEQSTLAFGIKNTGSESAKFCALVVASEKDADVAKTSDVTDLNFYYDTGIQALDAQQDVVIPLTVDAEAKQDLYQGKIFILKQISGTDTDCSNVKNAVDTVWKEYATKSFFINIQ